MGEAKRRRRKDPSYGKSEMIGGRTYLEWKKYLYFTDREWKEIKPHFRVVNSVKEIDGVVDEVWIYIDKGQENIAFTGRFTSYLSSDMETLILHKVRQCNKTKIDFYFLSLLVYKI